MKKTLSILIMMIAFVFNMNAESMNDIGRCRLINMQPVDYSSNIEKSEADLLSGIWILGSNPDSDVNQKFIFEKNGKLFIFNETTERGITVDEKKWRLMDFEGEVYLVFEGNSKGKDELFRMNQTCDGMELKNAKTGKLMAFEYKSLKQSAINKSELVGNWTTTQYPFEIAQRFDQPGTFEPVRGAFVSLDLNDNGSYTRSYGGEVKSFSEHGTWTLSRDGKYIVLASSNRKFGENNLQAIEIQKLNNNKLVVRSAISANNLTAYTTGTKLFHFAKKS
ncbi:MAG: hypothetical protein IT268_11475 [Saprospiraceae bacterium]|nr:hypothetical protein [Saprospiraceae bacterium]